MIPDFGESDVLHFHLPLKVILSESLKNKVWPLWTPYIGNGFPILAEGQIGTFYLPNLIFYRFLPIITAYNLNLVLIYILIAAGTYLFARSLNLSYIPSFFASLIFTFSGFFSVHLNHYDLIQTASLMPLIFWAGNRIASKPRFTNSVLLGFFVSQQIFAGYVNIVFITWVGLFLFWGAGWLFDKEKNNKKFRSFLFFIVITCVITFILSAIQLVPTLEIWQLSSKSGGVSFDTATNFPYPYKHLLTFFNPYLFGNPSDASYPVFRGDWGIFWENTAYLGIAPLILAFISLFFIKNYDVRKFLIILLVSLLIVFGKFSPVYFIFSFPPFNFFRVPSKFLLLTAFSLTFLSAIVINKFEIFIMSKIKPDRKIIFATLIIIILSTLVFIDEYKFSYNYPPISPASFWQNPPDTAKFLSNLKIKQKIYTIGAPNIWNNIFLKKGWQDISRFTKLNNSLYPNYNLNFKFATPDLNMGGLIPRRIGMNISLLNEIYLEDKSNLATINALSKNALFLSGVGYLISSYEIGDSDFTKIYNSNVINNSEPSFSIYKFDETFPLFYVAYKSKIVETDGDIVRTLTDDKFHTYKTILVEDNKLVIDEIPDSNQQADLLEKSDTEYEFLINSASNGIFVNNITYYPGWSATVDGKRAEIYPVNLNQQGIQVEKGTHIIRLWYKSDSFDKGKRITTIGSVIIFSVMFLYRVFWFHTTFHKKRPSSHL